MKRYAVVLAVVVLFIFASKIGVFAKDIIWDDIGRGNLNLRTVLINPDNPQIIYIGSSNAIVKSEDGGVNWRNILSVKGQNKAVNFLLFEPKEKKFLYAATGNGLFYSFDYGKNWSRIFKGKSYLENECTTLAVLSDEIYLGTKSGLFVSRDRGRSWHKETASLGNSYILAIVYNLREPNYIYVACVDGVFKTKDKGESWERIFTAYRVENGFETEEEAEDQDEQERFSGIRYISCDPNNLNCLYVATSKGIHRSCDRGQNWESVSSYGLLNQDVRFLLISSKSNLYAATKTGVFEYRNDRWQELSLHLLAGEVRFLSLDSQDNLYAACDKGLFKASVVYSNDDGGGNIISLYYKDEPKINEVQQAAIKYAQVIDPLRIDNLRKQARVKAILPELSLNYDRTITSYSNSTSTRFEVGPSDWGVSLKWSLSDLIWSEQQRLIDGQARLVVQLRTSV